MIYKEIKENSKAEIIEKKSRFICELYYINEKEEADKLIKEAKRKYHDARHNCYAYIIWDIDKDNIIIKSSDDGEPSGTAGAPILNALQSNNLVNVLAIVTRYFGGVLLGTGGLVRAYKEAALKAIQENIAINVEKGYVLNVEISYNENENFIYFCKKNNITIIKTQYLDNIKYILEINEEKLDMLKDKFKDNEIKYDIIRQKPIQTA